MADWTEITNVAVAVGEPTRAIDGRALRDNPIAIARGAPGAPRLSPWAAVPDASAATGTQLRYRINGPFSNAEQQQTVATAVMVTVNGTVRVDFDQSKEILDGSPGNIQATIERQRGAAVTVIQSWETNGSAARTVNVAVQPGDSIVLRHRGRVQTGGLAASNLTNFRISTSAGSPFFLLVLRPGLNGARQRADLAVDVEALPEGRRRGA